MTSYERQEWISRNHELHIGVIGKFFEYCENLFFKIPECEVCARKVDRIIKEVRINNTIKQRKSDTAERKEDELLEKLGVGMSSRKFRGLSNKQQYRVLALVCHPDRGGSHEAMVELNKSWEKFRS